MQTFKKNGVVILENMCFYFLREVDLWLNE